VKTVGEIDASGRIVRIFHRTDTATWTHAPGEEYRYWTDRGPQAGRGQDRYGWVEMRCDCRRIPDERQNGESSDESARSRTPRPHGQVPRGLRGPVVDSPVDQPRRHAAERYAPTTVEVMLRLQDGPARSFIVAAALGSFLHGNGSSERLRSGRDAAGSLITPRKLPAVLEALKITERHWRRLTADWEDRYIAHPCGQGKVFLFSRRLLMECPACHAEIPVTKSAPSPKTRRGSTRDRNGRWRSAETDRGGPPNGRKRSAEVDGTGPLSGTDTPHRATRSLPRGEVGIGGEVVLQSSSEGSSEGSSQTRRDRDSRGGE